MLADLHLHTQASDGELDPLALLTLASEHGIARLSITDHDTLAAYRWRDGAVFEAASRLELELIVGVELDTLMDGREVHLLGYAVDGDAPVLASHLAAVRDARRERAVRELALVNEKLGVGTLRDEQVFAPGCEMPMRPHLIRPLLEQGRFASYREASAWFRDNTAAGLAVPKPEVARAIAMVHDAGGWAVLAHPGYYWKDGLPILDRLADLRALGLDGIEVEYPYDSASPELFAGGEASRFTTDLGAAADVLGLRQTRGSDVHFARDFERVYGRSQAEPLRSPRP